MPRPGGFEASLFLPSFLSFLPSFLPVQKVHGVHGGILSALSHVPRFAAQTAAVPLFGTFEMPSRPAPRAKLTLKWTNGCNEGITDHWLGNISAAIRGSRVCRAAGRKQ